MNTVQMNRQSYTQVLCDGFSGFPKASLHVNTHSHSYLRAAEKPPSSEASVVVRITKICPVV